MKDKEIIEKVNSFTINEKLSLWINYMVDIIALNHDYKIISGKYYKGDYYPILNVTIWKYMNNISKHRIEPFESWIVQKENNHDLTGIYSYYRKINLYNKLNWNKYDNDNSILEYESIKKAEFKYNTNESHRCNCGCKK